MLDAFKIPQRIGFGNYKVDYSMDYLIYSVIPEFQKDYNLNLTPDFQRAKVWTLAQKSRYLEFLLTGGISSSPLLFNHPGWLKSWKGEFVCVDGLQRITALQDFFADTVPIFGEYTFSNIENIHLVCRSIRLQVYINDLKTREQVLTWYLQLNSGGTVHTEEELDKVRKLLEVEKS